MVTFHSNHQSDGNTSRRQTEAKLKTEMFDKQQNRVFMDILLDIFVQNWLTKYA